MSKKVIIMSLVVVCICTIIVGAIAIFGKSTEPTSDYEAELLDMGAQALAEFKATSSGVGELSYKVSVDKDGTYTVDIDREKTLVPHPKDVSAPIQTYNERRCPSWVRSLLTRAKKLVKDFIDNSSFLQGKDELKKGIEDITPVVADFVGTEDGVVAFYQDGHIYISTDSDVQQGICEWMLVHELIHGLADLTNKGVVNEVYGDAVFSEAITEAITLAINPRITPGIQAEYNAYLPTILIYIGIFQEEALDAYFYGYDDLYKKVDKTELDFWVYSLENVFSSGLAQDCIGCSLYKWAKIAA